MPKPTLKSLGISEGARQLLKEFIAVHDITKRVKGVATPSAPGRNIVSSRLLRSSMAAVPAKPATKKKTATKSASDQFHEVRRMLDERAFYPPHSARKESAEYAKVHKQLVSQHGCLICGVKNDVLKDKSKRENLQLNPYAAKQLETHHHVIEWALANAIDTDKFNKLVFPHLKARHPGNYKNPLTQVEIRAWVDHSPDNLWVLCDVHHRAKYFGIHEITDPLWGPQDIFNDAFLAQVREAIGSDASGKGKLPGKKTKKATGPRIVKSRKAAPATAVA